MLHTPPTNRAQELNLLLSNLPIGTPPELLGAIEDAVRDTLDRHGICAFAMPRDAAVVHEVGHAIVGTHEGFLIRCVSISSRPLPKPIGVAWGGRCLEAGNGWTTGPDTSAEADLRRARMIVAGLAGEAVMGKDRSGSSLDELALSQLVGLNAACKLDGSGRRDNEYGAYAKQLWHDQVWRVAVSILYNNREPFMQLAGQLHQKERIQGGQLRKILAQVNRQEAKATVAP